MRCPVTTKGNGDLSYNISTLILLEHVGHDKLFCIAKTVKEYPVVKIALEIL